MLRVLDFVDGLDLRIIVLFCLTLGLAPYSPPHIIEKLNMLFNGNLVKSIDWFDLLFHGSPWILLAVKTAIMIRKKHI